jgi:hypothetical protein
MGIHMVCGNSNRGGIVGWGGKGEGISLWRVVLRLGCIRRWDCRAKKGGMIYGLTRWVFASRDLDHLHRHIGRNSRIE